MVACLCLQCRLPGGAVGTAARCPQCGLQYMWPMPTFVPVQAVEVAGDVAMLSAELPGALWRESADPGEWGSGPVVKTEPEEKGTIGRSAGRETNRQSPSGVPLTKSGLDSSDEDPVVSPAVVTRQPANPCGGNGRKVPLTCVVRERSRVSPVQRKTERRSPPVLGAGGSNGEGRSTPTPRSGKSSPCSYQAPRVASAEEGRCQAQAVRQRQAELPDVVVEEEVPLGDPTQDGGASSTVEGVPSGGRSGADGEMTTPFRSGSVSRSPGPKKSWQALRKAESGETQATESPCGGPGPCSSGERVGTPWIPTVRPYAQPQALVKAPTPVTFSHGSSSSLGMSGGSQVTSEERTGERLDCFTSDDGSMGGGYSREVSVSSDCPSIVSVTLATRPKRVGPHSWSTGTSGVSSWGEPEEGDSEESAQEEIRETRWWAPLFEGYEAWLDRTRFLLEREGVVDYWWARGEFTEEERVKALQDRWYEISHGMIEPLGPSKLGDPVDPDEPLSWVLPGRAGNTRLIRSSRAERAIITKYKNSHGLEYPYVPEPLMQEIEDQRDRWLRETIEQYMVNRGGAITGRKAEERISQLMRVWSIGRSIYMHKAVYRPESGLPREYSITVTDMGGREVKKPDPRHYY
ncbi:uncharacterized protein LOC142497145 isoform X2 [Ascaphus truei]